MGLGLDNILLSIVLFALQCKNVAAQDCEDEHYCITASLYDRVACMDGCMPGLVVTNDGFTSVSSSRISAEMITMIVSAGHEPRETSSGCGL